MIKLLAVISFSIITLIPKTYASEIYSEDCKPFSYSNFNSIRVNSIDALYKNPFNPKKCFPLLFEENEKFGIEIINKKFHNVLIKPFTIFNRIKGVSVRHAYIPSEDITIDFMRYARTGNAYKHFELYMDWFDIYKKYGDVVIFSHEIYHLNDLKQYNDISEAVSDEISADVFGLLMTLKSTNITTEDLVALTEIVLELRIKSYSGSTIKQTNLVDDNPLAKFHNIIIDKYKLNKLKMEINICSTLDCISKYTSRNF
jgi:hypothetical protein